LTERPHDHGIGGIGAWKLHVIGELVRRDTLQHQLASISIFALVTLERNPEESYSDDGD
jgi:hypothetical protein